MKTKLFPAVLILTGLAFAPAWAGPIKPDAGMSLVTDSDVAAGPVKRQDHPNHYLSDSGDYDGDGKTDQVALMRMGGAVMAVARLSSDGTGPNYPFSMAAAWKDVARLGMKTVKPGTYAIVCPPSQAGTCDKITTTTDTIEVFTVDTATGAVRGQLFVYRSNALDAVNVDTLY